VLRYVCEMCGCVGWSSSIVDITEAKEMCSVSVSCSKVVALASSRLALEKWCIAFVKACS